MLEKVLEITTRMLKMNFPVLEPFLKILRQKSWSQYLGNYSDYSDGTYTYLGRYTNGKN